MPTSPFSDWELDLACVRPWHSPSTRSAAPSPAPEHDRNLLLEPLAAQGKATVCRGSDLRQLLVGNSGGFRGQYT
jgi:hypothetical protein